MAIPGVPGLNAGKTIRTTTGQRYQVGYRPNGQIQFQREAFNGGGYAGLIGASGKPIGVNLAQAYGNLGGKLPGRTYSPGAGGAGQWSAPGGTGTPGATPGTAAPGTDPRDATYYQNVAANQFKVQQAENAEALQGSQANTALQSALGQLAYQQPRDALALEQRANAAGTLYSSPYAQNQGNLEHTYATKQDTLQSNYANLIDKLAAQIQGQQAGVPIYNAGQYLAAAGRAAAAAEKNPATGQPLAVGVPGQGTGAESVTHQLAPRPENVNHRLVAVRPRGDRVNRRY